MVSACCMPCIPQLHTPLPCRPAVVARHKAPLPEGLQGPCVWMPHAQTGKVVAIKKIRITEQKEVRRHALRAVHDVVHEAAALPCCLLSPQPVGVHSNGRMDAMKSKPLPCETHVKPM
eukprot:366486-Chlamydomonas_euryale.AAC.9